MARRRKSDPLVSSTSGRTRVQSAAIPRDIAATVGLLPPRGWGASYPKAPHPRLSETCCACSPTSRSFVHATAVDADLGFRRLGGYARFEAEHLTNRVELARPPLDLVRRLQFACFAG